MQCPVCRTTTLEAEDLERNLRTLRCGHCGGHWVQAYQYWMWLEEHSRAQPERPAEETVQLPVEDSPAKVCPECQHILWHNRVGHGLDFYIDRCSHCGGLWFDRNEWVVLKSRNLHDDVHFVFNQAWQHRVALEDRAENTQELLTRLLGPEDLAEARRVKAWIDAHPRKDLLRSYLVGQME
jgi:Zn-finger nucleic acid-binding protein